MCAIPGLLQTLIFIEDQKAIMQSTKKLVLYYQTSAENSWKILSDREALKDLMEQNSLLILLRYVENIALIQTVMAIKTLLLAVRLLKLNNPKLKSMLSQLQIRMLKDNFKDRPSNDVSVVNCLIQRLEVYFNYLIKNEVNSSFPNRTELQILTTSLLKLSESSFSKDKELSKYCDFVYWLAEEELFELWRQISTQFECFQGYGIEKFHSFYQMYTNFCTYRRKIPKIKQKKLKEVVIKSELNSKIQQKWRQSSRKSGLQRQAINQAIVCSVPSFNFQRLAISDDFQ